MIVPSSEYVEDGGLMTYSVSVNDLFRRAVVYVDKILKGAKPGDQHEDGQGARDQDSTVSPGARGQGDRVNTRRELLIALGASFVSWPFVSNAQPPAQVARIGFLSPFARGATVSSEEAFRHGLRDLGWVEGKNIAIEYRFAESKLDRLPDLAADLVRLKVDVIVTSVTPDALAAQRATRTIPIVMAAAGDPVASGVVASLARPGGNVTGSSQAARSWSGNGWSCSRKSSRGSPAWRCSRTHRAQPRY